MEIVAPPANQTVTIPDATQPLAELTSQHALPGEINGVDTWIVSIPAGQAVELDLGTTRQVINFLISGSATVQTGEQSIAVEPMTLLATKPGQPAAVQATTDCVVLKIAMDLREEESSALDDSLYPMVRPYAQCEKYRDYFKSEKTVSRTLVHPFTLPRFSMGSVETTGPDRIEPHAHPMLDQLFFSFAENSCSLLIDGETYHYGGHNLLHIPLGSDHGVQADPGDVVHYLWLDFFDNAQDMQYLVDVHTPVDE